MDQELRDILSGFTLQFEKINQRFDQIDQRLDKLEHRMDKVEQRLDQLEQRMDKRLDHLQERLNTMDSHMDKFDSRLDIIQDQVVANCELLKAIENRVTALDGRVIHLFDHAAAAVDSYGKAIQNQIDLLRSSIDKTAEPMIPRTIWKEDDKKPHLTIRESLSPYLAETSSEPLAEEAVATEENAAAMQYLAQLYQRAEKIRAKATHMAQLLFNTQYQMDSLLLEAPEVLLQKTILQEQILQLYYKLRFYPDSPRLKFAEFRKLEQAEGVQAVEKLLEEWDQTLALFHKEGGLLFDKGWEFIDSHS